MDDLNDLLATAGLRDVADRITPLAKRCVVLKSTWDDRPATSKLGGNPDLPGDFRWPEQEKPLTFLAQLSLDQAMGEVSDLDVPTSGMLSFFYDYENMPWGYDPKDAGGAQLFYFPDKTRLKSRTPPEAIEFDAWFEECHLKHDVQWSLPGRGTIELESLNLADELREDYLSLVASRKTCHKLGGYPDVIQNPMQLACQLVTNGLYCGNSSGYNDARAESLASGVDDWRLLLQVDSDDDIDLMWGDCGRLYVWIRKQDLADRRFDKTWTILQCY